MKSRRVLILGMDAADQEILLRGCEQGDFPTFARLKQEGAWGLIGSLPGFGSGAVWPSFFTGVSPASHGRYFYRQVWPGEYEATRFEASDFKAEAFWDLASAEGKRVAVFDVPKAGLSPDINGMHAVDWLVHGPVYKKLTTAPGSLATELESEFGLDAMPQCDQPGGRTTEEHRAMRDLLVDRIRLKERATLHYLEQEPWDLFVTVFGEPHCVGHQSWHLRDASHPAHEPGGVASIPDPIVDVYRAVDQAMGRIIQAAGPDVTVLVVSITGMGPNYTGNYILDEALRRIDHARRSLSSDLLERAKFLAKRILPREIRRRYRRKSRSVEERFAHHERARRRFFSVPHNDIAGAIRVNLKGREPQGIVDPAELASLHETLRNALKGLRNLETGRPVVVDVIRTADICSGEHLEDLPDFFVLWERDARIERVGSEELGEWNSRHRGNRTGDHHPESIFFSTGPGITSCRIENAAIMDFAPTVARWLGIDWEHPDGHVIDQLVPADDDSGSPG